MSEAGSFAPEKVTARWSSIVGTPQTQSEIVVNAEPARYARTAAGRLRPQRWRRVPSAPPRLVRRPGAGPGAKLSLYFARNHPCRRRAAGKFSSRTADATGVARRSSATLCGSDHWHPSGIRAPARYGFEYDLELTRPGTSGMLPAIRICVLARGGRAHRGGDHATQTLRPVGASACALGGGLRPRARSRTATRECRISAPTFGASSRWVRRRFSLNSRSQRPARVRSSY